MSDKKTRVRETQKLEPAGRELKGKTLERVIDIDGDPKADQVEVPANTPLSGWEEKK